MRLPPLPHAPAGPAVSGDGLVTPGWCLRCERRVPDSMAVAYVETGSGPGGIVEACVRHARQLAASPAAPQWLKDDIAALDGSITR
ncbi:hypothetical protein [Streptomyces boncukensis]|uniref:Uncharacterized protein n=1 Tax=Streptomyces boncukensis TaxID=2711219 RepID=A0A6G4WXG7_9ACTN|nr:hypothetical protein [Streptomyces boncukensis]NGO69307.1 hypothetical protein [Streptomyces boncukensis]